MEHELQRSATRFKSSPLTQHRFRESRQRQSTTNDVNANRVKHAH